MAARRQQKGGSQKPIRSPLHEQQRSTSSGAWPTPAAILQIWAAAHSFNDQHPIKKSRFHNNGGSRIPFME
ncbi:hypothetical protein ACLOJK_022649, partial [Asimina triloba]